MKMINFVETMRFNLIRISHSDQVYLNKPLAKQRAQIHLQQQQPQHREKKAGKRGN